MTYYNIYNHLVNSYCCFVMRLYTHKHIYRTICVKCLIVSTCNCILSVDSIYDFCPIRMQLSVDIFLSIHLLFSSLTQHLYSEYE